MFSSKQLSVANFENVSNNEKFRISHLQQILPKLTDANLELGHKVYISLPNEYFIQPSNRTYFQGICHAIYSFLKIDKQYSIKYKVKSIKTQSIFKVLCTNQNSKFLRKARSTEIDKFLNGYHQVWATSQILTKQYLEPILFSKANESDNKNINFSTFCQGIKRLIDLDTNEYKPIAIKIFESYKLILKESTKNIDIRKISYGLEQLSILSHEVDQFSYEISDIILEKCLIENKQEDFKTGAFPELVKALKGRNGKNIIDKIKNMSALTN